MGETILRRGRRVSVVAIVLVCAVLCCTALLAGAQPVHAAEMGSLSLKVSQHLGYPAGESGLRQTWEYQLERATADAPLPEGASVDTYRWSMAGDRTDSVAFTVPSATGDYWYTMRQVAPDRLDAAYTADGTVYDVRLHIGSGGAASVLVYKDGVKVADPSWTVTYHAAAPTPQKPSGIVGAIASALPKTGDMSYLVMGAAFLIAVVGVCSVALGRSLAGRRVESATGTKRNYDGN